ncbi:MAG: ThuA domain-containing protein [Balneolales bacterium]
MIPKTNIPVLVLPLIIILSGMTGCVPDNKQILFIAGAPSHGFGNHEHLGGSTLLAQTLEEAGLNISTTVVDGWPDDASLFDEADAVVIYSNGGSNHPVMDHLEEFSEVMDRGVGFVTLHYAVEVPVGEAGNKFLKWNGGFFETDWSVNPFWTTRIHELPDHPVSRGVGPIEINDEWYYHMRFAEGMQAVTPILSDLPPVESLSREDGPHSNNPHVRQAVIENQQPQHVAWATEREDGGRAFGFTGGHYHWNWGHDEFRRVVANAIVWAAGGKVPENGVAVRPVTVLELAELTDDPVPGNWAHEEIQDRLDAANKRTSVLD